MTVQTGCSSSLVAVHLACKALERGECDAALVVAAGLSYPQAGHIHVDGGIKSGTGRCRPFDAGADGVVESTGVVAIVLARQSAVGTGTAPPYGYVLGSAIGNDGSGKQAFTAPSRVGQARVMQDALHDAGSEPSSVGYLECHGTGTYVGDPVEWASSARAYGSDGALGPVWIGATKANAGHTDGAAGLLGLVKALEVVRTGDIPPVAGFREINPLLNETPSRFSIPRTAQRLDPQRRRAGVSAFGVGGTNAHVIVEAPRAVPEREGRPTEHTSYLQLSAADASALARLRHALADFIEARPDMPMADIAATLARGRKRLAQRFGLAAPSPETAVAGLRGGGQGASRPTTHKSGRRPVILMFPGQASQYPGMGLAWEAAIPEFREWVDALLARLDGDTAALVERALFDPSMPPEALAETALAQPALCILELAAFRAVEPLGLAIGGVIGHSLGEIPALVAAGGLSAEQALDFAVARGRAMQACPPGRMFAVMADASELATRLPEGAHVSSVNGPQATTISTAHMDSARIRTALEADFRITPLTANRAFHSPLIEPSLPAIRVASRALDPWPLHHALARNHDGRAREPGTAIDPHTFVAHARRPVRFQDGLTALARRHPDALCLEIGPGRGLAALARAAGLSAVSLGRSARSLDDVAHVGRGLADLWTVGGCDALPASGTAAGRLRHLPTYPFDGPVHIHSALATKPKRQEAPLPEPEHDAAPAGDDAESALRAGWRSLLGTEKAEYSLDFYDAGGDSLTLIRLVAHLKDALALDLSWRDLAGHDTFGAQLHALRDLHADAARGAQ